MGDFHFLGNTSQDDLLMAPVKLVGLSWGKLQWNIALLRSAAFLLTPFLHMTLYAVVGTLIPFRPEYLIYPLGCKSTAFGPFNIFLEQLLKLLSKSSQLGAGLFLPLISVLGCSAA